jgi:hypothetical protein
LADQPNLVRLDLLLFHDAACSLALYLIFIDGR